jgi:hypothetical protein
MAPLETVCGFVAGLYRTSPTREEDQIGPARPAPGLGRIIDPFGYEWEIGMPIGSWPPT